MLPRVGSLRQGYMTNDTFLGPSAESVGSHLISKQVVRLAGMRQSTLDLLCCQCSVTGWPGAGARMLHTFVPGAVQLFWLLVCAHTYKKQATQFDV